MTQIYPMFGLQIQSSIPLGTQPNSRARKVDIQLLWGRGAPPASQLSWYHHMSDLDGSRFCSFAKHKNNYLIRIHGGADFLIRKDGKKIVCVSHESEQMLQAHLLSFVLPFAVELFGFEVLHAAAVRVGKSGLAFMGNQGLGKSTLAAAFARQSFKILSDDALPIAIKKGQPILIPSFPEIRLAEESLRKIWGKEKLKTATTALHKKRAQMAEEFWAKPLPLKALLLLSEQNSKDASVSFEELSGQESLLAMLNNSYRLDPLNKARIKKEAETYAQIVESIPVLRIRYPRKLHLLPRVVDRILSEVSL